MRKILLATVIFGLFLTTAGAAAEKIAITGTWSGNWAPTGGSPDAITVEFREAAAGKLTGKFLTPTPMDFTEASFNPATLAVTFEATDIKAGKLVQS
jgi:hypothetical protein